VGNLQLFVNFKEVVRIVTTKSQPVMHVHIACLNWTDSSHL